MQITSKTSQVEAMMLLKSHVGSTSRIYATDQFYGNVDRHLGNFLFVPRGGEQTALAMDFSRAGPAIQMPFGAWPLRPNCQTQATHAWLVRSDFFDDTTYQAMHQTLTGLQGRWLHGVLDSAPSEWFAEIDKQQILDWWDNERSARLSELAP